MSRRGSLSLERGLARTGLARFAPCREFLNTRDDTPQRYPVRRNAFGTGRTAHFVP